VSARLLAFVAIVPLGSCVELGVYRCDGALACGEGTCEPNGYCSYADGDCPSGRRYSELAGEGLARDCVDTMDSGTADAGSDDGTPQSGDVVWEATIAGADHFRDLAWGVVFLGSGDVIVGGVEGTATAANDMLLARFAGADGQPVWTWRNEGGAQSDDEIHDVAIDATGRIIAGGYETTIDGGMQAWVGAFDGEGTPVFDHHPPGFVVNAVAGNSGGFLAAGAGGDTEDEGFVASYWEGGTAPQWIAESGLVGADGFTALARIAEDEVFVAGVRESDVTLHRASAGALALLAEIDGESMLVDDAQGLALHKPSGDVVIVGFQTTAFAHDAWLARFAPDGTRVFELLERTGDLEVDEEFEDVAVDGAGNIVAVGFVIGDDRDAWVRKYDPAGALSWSRVFDDVGDSIARAIDLDGQANIAIAGEIVGPDGSRDLWVAKLTP
jgi:hypothetical protein